MSVNWCYCPHVENGAEEETSVREFLHLQEHVAHADSISFPNAQASYWTGRLSVLSLFPSSFQE